MNIIYLGIYNNLIKLTRNKNLYTNIKQDTFYLRMIIFFLHLSFFLRNFKNVETKKNLQNFFDFCVRQVELSIREIGYGDATINKKMKDYINLLFSMIDKIHDWNNKTNSQKVEILKIYLDKDADVKYILDYVEKYRVFLLKNTFKNLSKDILNF